MGVSVSHSPVYNHIAVSDTHLMDKESKEGRMADALALGGDEGRDKLR